MALPGSGPGLNLTGERGLPIGASTWAWIGWPERLSELVKWVTGEKITSMLTWSPT